MRKTCLFVILAAFLLAPLAATAQVLEKGRLRDVLPAEGLDKSSVVVLPDQAALNVHYYLADDCCGRVCSGSERWRKNLSRATIFLHFKRLFE